jgi:hypothetical protein
MIDFERVSNEFLPDLRFLSNQDSLKSILYKRINMMWIKINTASVFIRMCILNKLCILKIDGFNCVLLSCSILFSYIHVTQFIVKSRIFSYTTIIITIWNEIRKWLMGIQPLVETAFLHFMANDLQINTPPWAPEHFRPLLIHHLNMKMV